MYGACNKRVVRLHSLSLPVLCPTPHPEMYIIELLNGFGVGLTAIMVPDIITFCLSGGTPVSENNCILNTSGDSSVFTSTLSYRSLPHFTFTTNTEG